MCIYLYIPTFLVYTRQKKNMLLSYLTPPTGSLWFYTVMARNTSYKYWTNPIYRIYNPIEITSYNWQMAITVATPNQTFGSNTPNKTFGSIPTGSLWFYSHCNHAIHTVVSIKSVESRQIQCFDVFQSHQKDTTQPDQIPWLSIWVCLKIGYIPNEIAI